MNIKTLAITVRELLHERKFDDALAQIEAFSGGNDSRLSPSLLVHKGVLIQLASKHTFEPRDAERCLLLAIAIEPEHVKAHEELG